MAIIEGGAAGHERSRLSRWEAPAAAACAILTFVPFVRIPAGVLLLCFLPGVAICRSWLGERSPGRAFILGGIVSLCVIPATVIPAALVAGQPTHLLAVAIAFLVTLIASLRSAEPQPTDSRRPINWKFLSVILGMELLLQAWLSFAMYPAADTIRWVGLPDLTFFRGIHTQLTLHTPPFDPENGATLLIHNWIYHFHFALIHLVTGLSIPAMQRIASAWIALLFLGIAYLLASDVLERPRAGFFACLFLMTSGECTWLISSIAHLSLKADTLPWRHSPTGVMLLIGWYNTAPLVTGLAAWYWLERHRRTGRRSFLAASVAMCVAMAFFHPIAFGVFMTGFCLWLITVFLRGERRWIWLLYLATPVPFALLYKLPYYGSSMPPSVVSPDLTPSHVAARLGVLGAWGGVVILLGLAGMVALRGASGPLPWLVAIAFPLDLALNTPNPHWFHDIMFMALALLSGAGLVVLVRRSPRWGFAAAAAALGLGSAAFALQVNLALRYEHTFSAGELAAAGWLRENTRPDDLVAVFPNSPSGYTVEGLAGRRLVHGWTRHEEDFHRDAKERERLVEELFKTTDPARASEIAGRLRLGYLYVGAYERARSGREGLKGACFKSVFSVEPAEVYAYVCGQGA